MQLLMDNILNLLVRINVAVLQSLKKLLFFKKSTVSIEINCENKVVNGSQLIK